MIEDISFLRRSSFLSKIFLANPKCSIAMKWLFIVLETHFQFRTEREANAGLCSCNEQNREPAIGGSERNHATLVASH